MRKIGHLTPRYIYDRTAVFVDEKLHPQHPWLTRKSVKLLETLIKPSDIGVEFGSGRSTQWFLGKLDKLTSVETDPDWYIKVKKDCAAEIDSDRLVYLQADSEEDFLSIIDGIQKDSVDFCLVDGGHRDLSALNMVEKIKKGGLLVIDNVNWFIPNKSTKSPSSRRVEEGFLTETWKQFSESVSEWRCIWTSNGVTDTAIWIRK